jgi:hypothetical protein
LNGQDTLIGLPVPEIDLVAWPTPDRPSSQVEPERGRRLKGESDAAQLLTSTRSATKYWRSNKSGSSKQNETLDNRDDANPFCIEQPDDSE